MQFKSVLKPEGSIMSGVAVAGGVFVIYQGAIGSVASAQMTDANHPSVESCRKKGASMAFLFVSVMTLMTRDANVGILGYGTIIIEEIQYRHAIMADPSTGVVQPPAETSYQPAANVVPLNQQGYAVG